MSEYDRYTIGCIASAIFGAVLVLLILGMALDDDLKSLECVRTFTESIELSPKQYGDAVRHCLSISR